MKDIFALFVAVLVMTVIGIATVNAVFDSETARCCKKLHLTATEQAAIKYCRINPEAGHVEIMLTEQVLDIGSDGMCHWLATIFHKICEQGYVLQIIPNPKNDWIPSRVNPMTVTWTQKLAN